MASSEASPSRCVAVVTGAARGLGAAISTAFEAAGAAFVRVDLPVTAA
jgi:NAD(P)-dependent dehydrogenase (short-subunit alcohol dehydrogenase family)